ncbi:uncharacterized protein LOC114655664 isoform X1 [Erpetoichthys calabaricus]|uniref:uncharacterized protein LOC114655664 isoform X1 n=2 Tax=Erpetoichthys calabaricus TaxID=27687 RepID=UPI00109EF11D|nr:uncharacterized protein LOC114655664 isoform X1 [Erpetoichthys calabaricus]
MAKKLFKWTDEQTYQFIHLRMENENQFTGHRNSSAHGFDEIIKTMGLDNQLTCQQAKKKWENLKKKYKDLLLSGKESGTDSEKATAAIWPFFAAMHKAVGQRPSVIPLNLIASAEGVSPQGNNSVAQCPTKGLASEGNQVHLAEIVSDAESSMEKETNVNAHIEMDVPIKQCSAEHSDLLSRKTYRQNIQKRKSDDVLEFLKTMFEQQEKRFREAEEREAVRQKRADEQMERMLNILEKIVEKI